MSIVLRNAHARDAAKRQIDNAPEGFEVEIKPPRKTRQQEKLFHVLVKELAESQAVRWRYGERTEEEWKAELVKARFGSRTRPRFLSPNDVIVDRVSTRDLKVAQYNELIEFTYFVGAECGHVWTAHRPGEAAQQAS